jgi:hypothetical protein
MASPTRWRFQRHGPAVAALRFLVPAVVLQHGSQIAPRLGVARLELCRAAEQADGLLVLTERVVGTAQAGVERRVVGGERERALEQWQRPVRISVLHLQHTQQVMRVGVLGLRADQRPVALLGLPESPLPVQLQRLAQIRVRVCRSSHVSSRRGAGFGKL